MIEEKISSAKNSDMQFTDTFKELKTINADP
jgi:hypothetical protein